MYFLMFNTLNDVNVHSLMAKFWANAAGATEPIEKCGLLTDAYRWMTQEVIESWSY